MAKDQATRDAGRRDKEAKAQVEDLRLKVMPGTRQALGEIKAWAEVEENGEAMTLLIHRIHELGPEAARHFLSAPRHEITISPDVVRKLDQFRISRQMREPILMLGDDPDDTGIYVIEHRANH